MSIKLEKLSFHTPVIQEKPSSWKASVENWADWYASITNKIAYLKPSSPNEKQIVEIKETPWSATSLALTAFKILSYIPLILPALIAFAIKAYKKWSHDYYILSSEIIPTLSPSFIAPSTPSSAPLVQNEDVSILKTKGSRLTTALIYTGLYKYAKILYQEKQHPYYFIKAVDTKAFSFPFKLPESKFSPASMRVPHPQEGGLALVIRLGDPDVLHDPSAHFVAVFVDFKLKRVVYYDPFGGAMNPQVKAYVSKIRNSVFEKDDPVTFIHLNKRHQYDGYNCGRYAMNFLMEMMHSSNDLTKLNTSIKTLKKKALPAEDIYQKGCEWATTLY
jgi:hypothetical protein